MEFCIPGYMEKFDIEDVTKHFRECPLLLSATRDDKWSRGAEEVYENLRNAGVDVELKIYEGGHQFSTEMREYAYSFLSQKLKSE